jgi:DNA-binding CsgD family transcriptional regulator
MSKIFSYSSEDSDITPNFIEISIDPSLLNNFSNEESLNVFFSSNTTSEEFQKLKLELAQEILFLIETKLTKKQQEIIKLTYIDGKTQNQISSILGKNQSTVSKALQGNIDYRNKRRRYGGAIKKIRKLCAGNQNIKDILKKMKEKQDELKEQEE